MYRLTGLLTVLIFIAGCTANIGYQFADTLVEWKVKDYVDLNGEQQELLSEKVDELHQWHAQTQLPLYRKELKALRDKVEEKSLTQNDIGDFEADLLATLSVKQRQQLVSRLEEAQEERYQRLKEDKEQSDILRRLDRISDVEEDLEDILGDLTTEQDKLLRSWVSDSPQLREPWLSYRASWITEFEKALLKQPVDEEKMSSLILDPKQLRSESFQQKSEESSELRNKFLWDMYQSLTQEQRKNVIKKADEYIDLLDSLIKDFSN